MNAWTADITNTPGVYRCPSCRNGEGCGWCYQLGEVIAMFPEGDERNIPMLRYIEDMYHPSLAYPRVLVIRERQ